MNHDHMHDIPTNLFYNAVWMKGVNKASFGKCQFFYCCLRKDMMPSMSHFVHFSLSQSDEYTIAAKGLAN